MRTVSTASSRVVDACNSLRKAREPEEERSRSSRRRSGFRCGLTVGLPELEAFEDSVVEESGDVLLGGGNAEGCGSGGADDIVWKYLGIAEDVMECDCV